MEDESQVAVLVELGLVHRQIGITQSLAVHDRTHRNLVNVVLLFVVQEVFEYLVVFLQVVALSYQVSFSAIVFQQILSATILWVSLDNLSEDYVVELEVIRDEVFHFHLGVAQEVLG